ncbi:hypothetical protein RM531_08745 [Salinisphaera sp. P385]|uniref:Lipoprotein n=1 Tax=Spectribacter acetivorans TaxID=3075603 RepID=A0ABU3B7V9_9GAMM|nr:hypothetical protein [Salinisphaera sp. P385]MDT0618565.1 hypothetical protein [Salinisphaera sp. P385]
MFSRTSWFIAPLALVAGLAASGCSSTPEPVPVQPTYFYTPPADARESTTHTAAYYHRQRDIVDQPPGYRYSIWYHRPALAQASAPDHRAHAPSGSSLPVQSSVWYRYCNNQNLTEAEWRFVSTNRLPDTYRYSCRPFK